MPFKKTAERIISGMETMGRMLCERNAVRLIMIGLILGAGAVLFLYHRELGVLWESVKSGKTHPAYVIGAFIILPVVGFPILPLLLLMGIRFGAVTGLAIVFAAIPVHLLISFWITNGLFRKPIEKIIERRSLAFPRIPESHRLKYSIIFMILPGLSYSLKNYMLPLSGLPIVPFIFCGWLTQGILGIPFVVLGDAASRWNAAIFVFLGGIYVIFLIFGRRMTSAYRRLRPGNGQPSQRS